MPEGATGLGGQISDSAQLRTGVLKMAAPCRAPSSGNDPN